MTIAYSIYVGDDTAHVKASGIDESLSEVEAYGRAIIASLCALQRRQPLLRRLTDATP